VLWLAGVALAADPDLPELPDGWIREGTFGFTTYRVDGAPAGWSDLKPLLVQHPPAAAQIADNRASIALPAAAAVTGGVAAWIGAMLLLEAVPHDDALTGPAWGLLGGGCALYVGGVVQTGKAVTRRRAAIDLYNANLVAR
jgi:hypothetical protein